MSIDVIYWISWTNLSLGMPDVQPVGTWRAEIACQWWDCSVFASMLLLYRYNTCKESSTSSVTLWGVLMASWSETSFSLFVRRSGEMETSWRRGQPRLRQTWNPIQGLSHTRWRKDWVNVSCDLVLNRPAWNAWNVGSSHPGWMPSQILN